MENVDIVITHSNNIKSETQNWKLSNIIKNLNTVRIDEAFQSPSRWDSKLMADYMDSVFKGIAPSKFIFADVTACYNSCFELQDKEYYCLWKGKGASYLNLDSNNRFTTLNELFTNNLLLKRGTYYSETGEIIKIKKGQKWNDLDQNTKDFILNRRITVELYQKATREQISDIFIAVNSGSPLNAAEKRNAIISKICETCRNLAKNYYKDTPSWVITRGWSDKQYNRRLVDSQFASMAFYHTYGFKTVSDSILTEHYAPDTKMNDNVQMFEKDIKNFFNTWISDYQKSFEKLTRVSQATVYDLFVLYCKYNEQIVNINLFVEEFIKLNNKLMLEKDPTHRIDDKLLTYSSLLRGRETDKCIKRNEILENGLKDVLGIKINNPVNISLVEEVVCIE